MGICRTFSRNQSLEKSAKKSTRSVFGDFLRKPPPKNRPRIHKQSQDLQRVSREAQALTESLRIIKALPWQLPNLLPGVTQCQMDVEVEDDTGMTSNNSYNTGSYNGGSLRSSSE